MIKILIRKERGEYVEIKQYEKRQKESRCIKPGRNNGNSCSSMLMFYEIKQHSLAKESQWPLNCFISELYD